MYSFLKILFALLPICAFSATLPGHIDIGANGHITITAGRVAIGPQSSGPTYITGATTNFMNFDSGWANAGTNNATGWYTYGGLAVQARNTNFRSTSYCVRYSGVYDNPAGLYTPAITNGIAVFTCWMKSSATDTTVNFLFQRSTDRVNWTTVGSNQSRTTAYAAISVTVNVTGTNYFRVIRENRNDDYTQWIDDISYTSYTVAP